MKKTLVGVMAAVLAGAAGAGHAADLYAPAPASLKDGAAFVPAPVWTGFYFGANIGAAWSSVDLGRNVYNNNISVCETPAPPHHHWLKKKCEKPPPTPVCGPFGSAGFGGSSLTSTGVFGGGQFGYNMQTGNFVLGLEVDIGGMPNDGEQSFVASATSFGPSTGLPQTQTAVVRIKSEGGFYGDVTGRAGYAWGPAALVYAKGGFAWLDTNLHATATVDNGSTFSHDTSNTLTGYVIGTGFEYMISPSWTAKIEYLHFNFGDASDTWSNFDGTGRNNWRLLVGDLTVDTVKFGFNYILAPGYIPLK
jgi:outer membrane immunogenic protein